MDMVELVIMLCGLLFVETDGKFQRIGCCEGYVKTGKLRKSVRVKAERRTIELI